MDELDVEYLEHAMFLYQNNSSIVDLKPAERAKLLKKLFHFEFEDHVGYLRRKLEEEQAILHDTSIRYEEVAKKEFPFLELLPESDNLSVLRADLEDKRKRLIPLEKYNESYVKESEKALQEARDNFRERKSWFDRSKNALDRKRQEVEDAAKEHQSITIHKVIGDLDVHKSRGVELETQKSETEQKLAILTHSIKSLESQLAVASTGVCHACGHVVDEDHVKALNDSYNKKQLERDEERSHMKSIQRDITSNKSSLNQLENYLLSLEKKQSLELKIENLNSQISDVEASLQESEQSMAFAQNRLKEQEEKAKQIQFTREGIRRKQELESDVLSLEKQIESILHTFTVNTERRAINDNIKQQKQEHSELLASLATKYNSHSSQVDVLKKSLAVFETDFPNYIILKTCVQLESYINGFIQKVFPYMRVKLKPSRSGVDFFYVSQSSEDDWLSVKMASGAQSAILSLAWRIAIAKLYGVSTIVLDEADASATEETAQIIYQFISELDTFDQVIFISHKKQAMKELSSLIDNVVCYTVQDGEYTLVNELVE
jgi:DNA repair exonuclease SbcCD ATPase subunit